MLEGNLDKNIGFLNALSKKNNTFATFRYYSNSKLIFTIEEDILFDSVNINKNEIVTGLDITLYKYDLSTSESDYREIFKGNINADQTIKITSTEPILNVRYKKDNSQEFTTYTGFTEGKFYFDFTASLGGTYLFQILPFKAITTVYKKRISHVLPNHKENILKIDEVCSARELMQDQDF